MSAWIVSKAHIDLLVQGHKDLVDSDIDPNDFGQLLWRENYRSINYRYNERRRCPKYEYKPFYEDGIFHSYSTGDEEKQKELARMIIFAAHCYDYQTCEHPTYKQSKAYKAICELCFHASYYLANNSKHSDPNALPWGFEEEHRMVVNV